MITRDIIFAAIFWLCVGGIVYSYVLYAILIKICATLFGKLLAPPEISENLPRVSLLIAAYNEHEVIERRILNALESDYPQDLLEIVVASDGSFDNTAEIVRRYADRGVRLLDYSINRGKATVLNDSIPKLTGDIIVLSDANTFFQPDAVRNLVRWFANPDIASVCGRLVLTDPKTGKNVDGLYWKYETLLKKIESRLGALLGSNGAIYAIRRAAYVPIPPDTIVDDFVIPLLSKLKSHGSIVYDSDAVATEQTAPDISGEFHRRARIGAGGFQSIVLLWHLLDPRQGWIALTFFSHKILRWICPMLMIGAIIANAALLNHSVYRVIALLQVCFYAASGIAAAIPGNSALLKPARLASMFVGMNAALLVGFFRWISGRQRGAWRRTSRAAEVAGAV